MRSWSWRRGQSGGDQSQNRRHCEHGHGEAGQGAGAFVRRHRPGRRLCKPLRHRGALGRRRAKNGQGAYHQQLPGRQDHPGSRREDARRPHQHPGGGRGAHIQVDLDDEDSLTTRFSAAGKKGLLDIAVVRLPRISNFTDFNALSRLPSVSFGMSRGQGSWASPTSSSFPAPRTPWTT